MLNNDSQLKDVVLKGHLSAIVNALVSKIRSVVGDTSSLQTEAKDNLAVSINELVSRVDSLEQRITALEQRQPKFSDGEISL